MFAPGGHRPEGPTARRGPVLRDAEHLTIGRDAVRVDTCPLSWVGSPPARPTPRGKDLSMAGGLAALLDDVAALAR
ncbi:MAG: hypothetical protein L0J84_11800, partial [Brachybacterium sp.]|nr:hypothetical protein [Brachybacterium sp.]